MRVAIVRSVGAVVVALIVLMGVLVTAHWRSMLVSEVQHASVLDSFEPEESVSP